MKIQEDDINFLVNFCLQEKSILKILQTPPHLFDKQPSKQALQNITFQRLCDLFDRLRIANQVVF